MGEPPGVKINSNIQQPVGHQEKSRRNSIHENVMKNTQKVRERPHA